MPIAWPRSCETWVSSPTEVIDLPSVRLALAGPAFPGIINGVWCRENDSTREVSTTMTAAIQVTAKPEIEYPDDDGEPMADNTLQFKWIVLLVANLEAVFRNDPDVFVAGNLLWYPALGEPTIRAAPDAMVALGRPKGRRGSTNSGRKAMSRLRWFSRPSHPETARRRWNESSSFTSNLELRNITSTTRTTARSRDGSGEGAGWRRSRMCSDS